MRIPAFRTASLYAVLAGAFILIDLTIDRLTSGSAVLSWPHLMLAAVAVLTSFVFLNRAMETHRRAEVTLCQARDELETRVQERTAELARANQSLQTEIAERRQAEQDLGRSLKQIEQARKHAEDMASELQTANGLLRALIETMPAGVIITDSVGSVILANCTARTITGGAVTKSADGLQLGHTLHHMDGSFFRPEELPLVRAINAGETCTGIEAVVHRADGGGASVWMAASPVRDDEGRVISAVMIVQDISDRKQMEQALRESEETARALMNASPESALLLDAQGIVLAANQIAAERLKTTIEKMIGASAYDFISPQLADERRAQLAQVVTTGQPVSFEDERDGRVFDSYVHPVVDANGQVIRLATFAHDVTEYKRAEEALRESEERYRTQFDNFSEPTTLWSREGVLLLQNLVSAKNLGGKQEDFIGKTIYDLFGEPAKFYMERITRVIDTGITENQEDEVELPSLGKRIFWTCMQRIKMPDGQYAAQIISYDITGRKQVEEDLRLALEESRQRQAEVSALLVGSRAVLQHRDFRDAAQAIFDACKNSIGASSGYVALLSEDQTRNEPVLLDSGGLPCTVDADLPMPIRGLREQAYRAGEAVYENGFSASEWTRFLPEGHVCLDNVLFAPLGIKGMVVGLIGLANKPGGFNENDARLASAFGELAAIALFNRRAIEMLENSEERFRSVAQNASDAIVSYDSLGKVVFWNNAAEKIFGYSSGEMFGQPFTVVMPRHVRENHEHEMGGALISDKLMISGETIETTGLRKDGSPVPIELSSATWQTKEGRFYTNIIRDVTERKKSEATLHQAQAELAQRVRERTAIEERQRLARELHDSVSQALYGISLGAHTALTVLESDKAKVLEALNYVLSLTEAALTEMRALILELRPESLAMEGLATVLNKQVAAVRARHGIQVQTDLCQEPDVPLKIKEAVYRIAQEALNNAMKHARPSRLEVKLICDSESVLLEVRDDGIGFDPQASYPGHLGLRSMRERASSVGGALEIDSVPGCGTRIRAHIPTRAVELEPSA